MRKAKSNHPTIRQIGIWFLAELADGSSLSPFSHQTIVRKYKARRERCQGRAEVILGRSPMSVGVEAVVSHRDLTFFWNRGDDLGDELQVIQMLCLMGVFALPVGDLA